MMVEGDAAMLMAQQPAESTFADLDRFPAKVYAVQLEQVEGAKHHVMVMAPITDEVEHREPLVIDGTCLAIDDA